MQKSPAKGCSHLIADVRCSFLLGAGYGTKLLEWGEWHAVARKLRKVGVPRSQFGEVSFHVRYTVGFSVPRESPFGRRSEGSLGPMRMGLTQPMLYMCKR